MTRWRPEWGIALLAVVLELVDGLLAAWLAPYRRWWRRRKARVHRWRKRPLRTQLSRSVAVALVGRLAAEALRASFRWSEAIAARRLGDPDEAAQLLAHRVESIRARTYAGLCAELPPRSHRERVLGALTRLPHVKHEHERVRGPSGIDYVLTATMTLDRPGGPLAVDLSLKEVDGDGLLRDRFLIEDATGRRDANRATTSRTK